MGSQRCVATNNAGTQCKSLTRKGAFCWLHLQAIKRLRIKPSSIAGAGLGLWVGKVKQEPGFKKGDKVADYSGDLIEHEEDADIGGPYVLGLSKTLAIDASRTNVGEGRYANDSRGTGVPTNARLVCNPGRKSAVLEATRDLQGQEEVFVSYGPDYWKTADGRRAKQPPRKKASSDDAKAPEPHPRPPLRQKAIKSGKTDNQEAADRDAAAALEAWVAAGATGQKPGRSAAQDRADAEAKEPEKPAPPKVNKAIKVGKTNAQERADKQAAEALDAWRAAGERGRKPGRTAAQDRADKAALAALAVPPAPRLVGIEMNPGPCASRDCGTRHCTCGAPPGSSADDHACGTTGRAQGGGRTPHRGRSRNVRDVLRDLHAVARARRHRGEDAAPDPCASAARARCARSRPHAATGSASAVTG